MMHPYVIDLLKKKCKVEKFNHTNAMLLLRELNNPLSTGFRKDENPSENTLKRMLGIEGDPQQRHSTIYLDRIAHFLDYPNYDILVKEGEAKANGKFGQTDGLYEGSYSTMGSKVFYSIAMTPGAFVSFTYYPDRIVELKYRGRNRFVVLKSINSSMQPGEEYEIEKFFSGKELQTINLRTMRAYTCGKVGGIQNITIREV